LSPLLGFQRKVLAAGVWRRTTKNQPCGVSQVVVWPVSSSMLESTDFLSERLNRIGASEYLPLLKARHGRRTRLGGGMFVSWYSLATDRIIG